MKRLILVFFLLVLFYPFNLSAQQGDNNFFGNIANIQAKRLKLLEEKKPPMVPEKYLSMEKGAGNAFKAVKEISTKEELDKVVGALREKFLPFMKDLAPAIPVLRNRISLKEFQWRVETDGDKKDFINTLRGKGNWQKVAIPHFGPPLGKAVTYYYKKVNIPAEMLNGKALFACFKGVDYIAQVFLNGSFAGAHEGFFAPFEFNISKYAHAGENDLLIKVENDFTTTGFVAAGRPHILGDKIYGATGVGYDDFFGGGHQCAPGMGIYQDCYLEARSLIHIEDVFVRPLFDSSAAEIRVMVNNFDAGKQPVTFSLSVFGQNFNATVIRDSMINPVVMHVPGIGDLQKPTDWEVNKVKLGAGVNYFTWEIKLPHFRPWSSDAPWLYQLQVKVLDQDNEMTDVYKQSFGMRSFRMDTLSHPKGALYFNNEKIRLRGANDMGFMQQDVFKKDWKQLIDDILLAKACNMNFIRLTQRPEQPEVYEYADKLGMMLQTDFPAFGGLRYNKWEECVKQVAEMERLVRNHPSNILVTYINERFPNAEGYPHRNMSEAGQYFSLFRAFDEAVHKENPDRVIKAGDGDYDPPTPGLPDNHCYNTWYNGHGLGIGELIRGYWQWVKPGWYYGCGEFGAEGLDPVKTMYKYYPKTWLPENNADGKNWTADSIYAAQTQRFHYMWYPTQHSLKDWVEMSQAHQSWAIKTTAEAFRRDTNMVTQAVHLFIDAWPAGWMKAIMDVDRNPKKAFFAYRNALKPVIISLRTDRNHFFSGEKTHIEMWLCNDLNTKPVNARILYQLEHNGKVISSGSSMADVPVNSAFFQGYFSLIAPVVKKRTTYQLRAEITNKNGESIDQAVIDIDIFPREGKLSTNKGIAFLGDGNKLTGYLKKALNIPDNMDWTNADVVWVSDFIQYTQHKKELESMAAAGKRIILYNIPVGEYEIGNTKVTVQKTAMGSYYFVSPETGSKMTRNMEPFDFNLWFDEKAGYITPFLDKIVIAKDWNTILETGNTNWVSDEGGAMAAGELKLGKGELIICQLDLNNRMMTNPTANIFIHRLLLDKR